MKERMNEKLIWMDPAADVQRNCRTDRCMAGRLNEWLDGWMSGQMSGGMENGRTIGLQDLRMN